MSDIFQTLIANGHTLHDLKYVYTIDQVYLFLDKIKKMEIDRDHMTSTIMANCLLFASPAADASDARQKSRTFRNFLDTLDWKKIKEKFEEGKKPRTAEKTVKRLFGGAVLNVPFRNKKKKGDS